MMLNNFFFFQLSNSTVSLQFFYDNVKEFFFFKWIFYGAK